MPAQSTESITETLLESIYVISKHAKKEAAAATEHYDSNRKQEAKRHSNRKEALYTTKRLALEQIQTEAGKVTIDEIDNTNYYCLYFYHNQSEWVFHTPKRMFHLHPDTTVQNSTTNTLSAFSSTTEIPPEYNTLKQSLQHIKSTLQINANSHLPSHNSSQVNSLWYYL
jgi:hypothetical protein